MAILGKVAIWLSLLVSISAVCILLYGIKTRRKKYVEAGRTAAILTFVFITVASLVLLVALVNRNFSIAYVANHTSTLLPLSYTIAAFWAGQEGSLLLWLWLISLFTLIFIVWGKRNVFDLYALSILLLVQAFFILLLAIPVSPFTEAPFLMHEGRGLNPLLQHFQMIFHPPTLFMGFAGFTLPFAMAMAALLTRERGIDWLERCRRWALFAWTFLSVGIFLGGLWAYEVLGWGGYWAWDPVENASLFPWFTGTALLHSCVAYRKRKILRMWTVALTIATFLLCILATFLTRSGIISSVHAFGVSPIGPYFLWFMILVFLISFGILIYTYKDFRGEGEVNLLSREYGFHLNNLVMVFCALVILIGTMFPIFSSLVIGEQISPGPKFYGRLAIPLGLIYLLLMGICPILGWRQTSFSKVKRDIFYPIILGAIVAIAIYLSWDRSLEGSVAFFICAFAAVGVVQTFIREVRARRRQTKKGLLVSLWYLVSTNRARYGGLIAHLAIVIMVVGLIGTTFYKIDTKTSLAKNETFEVKDIKLSYEEISFEREVDKETVGAQLTLYEGGKRKGVLTPRIVYHYIEETSIARVAIEDNLLRDIFVALERVGRDHSVLLHVMINPLVSWLWIGCILLFIGTALAFWPVQKP
ncbi:MAG: cytochrome c-type biogenesis CcmF C-terminal domain-containing protein [Actinomycetota bacterium]|nr:cytochrome c-type biogenesis CcmF C-terminal domain-containing protein [Actinomycetota bacterium]